MKRAGPKLHIAKPRVPAPGDRPASRSLDSPPSTDQQADFYADRYVPGGDDLSKAPPPFAVPGGKAVFVDFKRLSTDLTFDVRAKTARVATRLDLSQPQEGFPVIDLQQQPTSIRIDGRAVDPSRFVRHPVPGESYDLSMLQQSLPPGDHIIELEYELPQGPYLQFDPDGARFFQYACDLVPGKFSEQFFPANLEYDQYPTTLNISVLGAERPHRVITNGHLTEEGPGRFKIDYPAFYNAASPYLDIIDPSRQPIVDDSFDGCERSVPITIYGKNEEDVAGAVEVAKRRLAELEGLFGPYPHESLVIRIDGKMGGMEYAGAAVSGARASTLEHEILHSWFSRCVMPAGGNDGWIDEAIATWAQNKFLRAWDAEPTWRAQAITGFSPYTRATPIEAYEGGAALLARLDFVFAEQGGLLPQLRDFFAQYKYQTVTTETFRTFMQARAPRDLTELFDLALFGRPPDGDPDAQVQLAQWHSRNKSAEWVLSRCVPAEAFRIDPAAKPEPAERWFSKQYRAVPGSIAELRMAAAGEPTKANASWPRSRSTATTAAAEPEPDDAEGES